MANLMDIDFHHHMTPDLTVKRLLGEQQREERPNERYLGETWLCTHALNEVVSECRMQGKMGVTVQLHLARPGAPNRRVREPFAGSTSVVIAKEWLESRQGLGRLA